MAEDTKALLEQLAGPMTFATNLRAIREADGQTQTEFAARLGISVQHLSNVENARKSVSTERAQVWAKQLGYSEVMFVTLAIEDQLRRQGMAYSVTLKAAG